MTTLSLKMSLQTTRYCHWPTQSATNVKKMRMYRIKRLLSKGGGIKNWIRIDWKRPFYTAHGQGLNFQVWAHWLEGPPSQASHIEIKVKMA